MEQLNEQIAATQEEREKKQDELAIAEGRLDSITRLRNSTEQTFIQLVNIEQLNLAQASLELEIAQQRQAEIEEAVNARLEREKIELARQRLEAQAKIEQLQQLQSEEELRQALNQARSDIGLKDLQGGDDPVQLQTQLAGLLAQLKDLEGQQPDLQANVKALLAEAKGDIHEALQGKEATTIQENLLKAMGGLIGQVQHHQSLLAELEVEAQWDKNLLAQTEQDLQGATQELLKEVEQNQPLQDALAAIEPLYTETLTKVAYASQAVDISQELAAQSRKLLEDVITQRVAERKARKKYFWNQMLGMVSSILSIVSMILLVIPPTTAIGAITAKIGLGVSLLSGAINATQAAINGDFMGAIFSAVMAGTSFVGGAIGNALQAGKQAILGMTQTVAKKVASTIKTMQALASGAYNSVRSFASGDSIMGFLNIVAGLASTATTGIAGFAEGGLQGLSDLGKFGYKVLDSLSKAPTAIYSGIKAIQSGDWVNGIGSIVKSVVSLANTWTNDFNDDHDSPGEKLANVLENISSVGIGVSKFITGGFQGLLDGIGDIVGGLSDDISKLINKIKDKHQCGCLKFGENIDDPDLLKLANLINVNPEEISIDDEGKLLLNASSAYLSENQESIAISDDSLVFDKKVIQLFLANQEVNGYCSCASQNLVIMLYKEGYQFEEVISHISSEQFEKIDKNYAGIVHDKNREIVEYAESFKVIKDEKIITLSQEEWDNLPEESVPIAPYKRPGNTGASPEKLGLLLHDYGIPITQVEKASKEQLIEQLKNGKPVVVGVGVSHLPYWKFNDVRDGHALTVIGVEDSNSTNPTFILADTGIDIPHYTSQGTMQKVKWSNFKQAWEKGSDRLMVYPNFSITEYQKLIKNGASAKDLLEERPSQFSKLRITNSEFPHTKEGFNATYK